MLIKRANIVTTVYLKWTLFKVQDLPDLISQANAGPNSVLGHSKPNHDARKKRFSITELFTEASQIVPPQNREGGQDLKVNDDAGWVRT